MIISAGAEIIYQKIYKKIAFGDDFCDFRRPPGSFSPRNRECDFRDLSPGNAEHSTGRRKHRGIGKFYTLLYCQKAS